MARIILVTPILTKDSIYHSTIGLPQKGTRGFGREIVRGLNRVPNPPTKIKAFIIIKWIKQKIS